MTITIDKTKTHTVYKTEDGKRVCGVTTILNVLNKPALVNWANRIGLEGIEVGKYVDQKANIGTLVHAFIMSHFKNEDVDTSDFTAKEIAQAENSLLSFFEWLKSNPIEPILIETPLVSETYSYGGTPDILGKINGDLILLDFKSGSGIYEEAYYQVCAYRQLLIEQGHEIKKARILNIPRAETEEFQEKQFSDFEVGWQIFLHCLGIYNLKKKTGK